MKAVLPTQKSQISTNTQCAAITGTIGQPRCNKWMGDYKWAPLTSDTH